MPLVELLDAAIVRAGRGGELLFALGVFLLAFRSRDLRKVIAAAPRPYVVITAVWIAATLLGHVFTRGQFAYPQPTDGFPVTRFAMFTILRNPIPDKATIWQFEGATEAGEGVHLNPIQLFPAIDFTAMHSRIRHTAEWSQSDSPELAIAGLRDVSLLGEALAVRYNQRGFGAPVTSWSLVKRVIDMGQPSTAQPVEQTVVFTARVENAAR
jgi:hypothetical protein